MKKVLKKRQVLLLNQHFDNTTLENKIKKICCLIKILVLGKLLNFFQHLPSVAYKLVAYKKNTCTNIY